MMDINSGDKRWWAGMGGKRRVWKRILLRLTEWSTKLIPNAMHVEMSDFKGGRITVMTDEAQVRQGAERRSTYTDRQN